MGKTPRKLIGVLAAAGFLTVGAQLLLAQRHLPRPNLRQQTGFKEASIADELSTSVDPKFAKAAMLRQNAQEFRDSVARLSTLVGELKEEVEKTPTTDVLSVKTFKKAQEIEKLAKQIKNKAKG